MINNAPFRIAVTGVTGRMGQEIIRCILKKNQQHDMKVILGAAIARVGADICGIDVGTLITDYVNNITGIIVTDDLSIIKNDFDILVDFTAPNISMDYLSFCVENHKNIVMGTTGFSNDQQRFITSASREIGIVYSANFSVGITLMLKLLNEATRIMGNISDINIVEMHHNKKVDVPSGTSLMMKNVISNVLSSIFKDESMYDRDHEQLHASLLSSYKIPIHSIRASNFVGEHSVLFASIGEALQIKHKVFDRSIFANGALCAAIWLGSDKVGLYSMCEVLGLNVSL